MDQKYHDINTGLPYIDRTTTALRKCFNVVMKMKSDI